MSGVHDVILGRVTNDLDLAVFVENENQFGGLNIDGLNLSQSITLTAVPNGFTQSLN